jgi:hypothetical protein
VPGLLFHDLRRAACRTMVEAVVNPQIARRSSGQVSHSMFQRYSILTTDDLRGALGQTELYRDEGKGTIVFGYAN